MIGRGEAFAGAGRIRAIVADIDGCFARGGRYPLDLGMLAKVRAWSEAAASDPSVPALCFCTARPLPYAIAMHQAAWTRLPSIVENGAIVWDPESRRRWLHPACPPDWESRMRRLLDRAAAFVAQNADDLFLEEGKSAQATFAPTRYLPGAIREVEPRIRAFAEADPEELQIDATHSVVSLMPPGVDKGAGIAFWSTLAGVPLDAVAAIGDAASDWSFMGRAAVAIAPAQSDEGLLAQRVWRTESGPGDVIVEAFEAVIAHNRGAG